MSQLEKDVTAVINGILDVTKAERQEKRAELIAELLEMKEQDNKRFWNAIEFGQHEFISVVSDVLGIPQQENDYIAEYIISGLYEHFFEMFIKKKEGSSCCADKASFITKTTITALYQKENLSLYDDYTKVDRIKKDKEKQAYWSPATIPDTDTAMMLFSNWYYLQKPE